MEDNDNTVLKGFMKYIHKVYNIGELTQPALELKGIPAMVVNASHMKNLPGRKTDVDDAEWIVDLLRHGLLRASFIPEKD